ncbi:hypothetical protein BDV95DRAFT_632467 [Massariosphaeria phaeospora]|uniref:Ankyrin repeat-containing domain protein n=1 Tax=Massariosphaeria phaeospora TaxID=100035 RepID=A0A7C8HYR8_9PLEO|nr:hypothetical protein BDV95DRAFT_632467 [Massariosphaeria phaeospora]
MTSNGAVALLPPAALDDPRPAAHARPPAARPAASPSSRNKSPASARLQNGDNSSDHGQNESEAETVVLDDAQEDDADRPSKMIKKERADDDNNTNSAAVRPRAVREGPRPPSLAVNGHQTATSDGKGCIVNGAKHSSERDAKSPILTSPSSRTLSRHTKDTSPTDSAASPAQTTVSPALPTTRGRSASTVESRKRKLRDDSHPKALEPPRQKAKTDALKDLRTQPTSPATPGLGRLHKRSQSTQSVVTGGVGRKRRDLTALALTTERDRYSDSSSENSSSPRPAHTPGLVSHPRLKRSSHRALTSPVRAMPARKVDKFGATRLARECERGDLEQVQAAYSAAPDELDQVDFAGIAPLQKAALHGWRGVVEFLISKACRTDCESNDRDTPLIDAVENGHLAVVKLLLNKGHVNPHHQNKKGQRAIDVLDPENNDAEEIEKELRAAMRRQTNAIKDEQQSQGRLHQQKSVSSLLYNEFNQETLIEKAGDGDISAVGELINSNIKPNIACGVAAARGGHYDILSILLASGLKADPDPSKHSETPMLVAIGRGHLKIIQLMLEQEVFDPTRRNREGKTYYEISEDRRGPKWEQEREILKTAYDTHRTSHRSPKKSKKEAPSMLGGRMKSKSSLTREHSLSPRPEPKRTYSSKSAEMASREINKQESEEDVRPPTKKVAKPRPYSEGEEYKPANNSIKPEQDSPKRSRKQSHRIHTKPEKINVRPTPDPDSLDERRPFKKASKTRVLDETIGKRRPSETPTTSAKSTPAPPEKASTPDAAAEAKRKAAEEEARKRDEEDAKHRAREAEEARKKAEAEAEAKRIAEAAEAARKQEARQEARRQEELVARQVRISKFPRALRRACEFGSNRPLHFSGDELGMSMLFLPLHYTTSQELRPDGQHSTLSYIMSFQAVGILGLPELDLARLDAPYSSWNRIPVEHRHRESLFRKYSPELLAQDYRFPMEGMPDFDFAKIQQSVREARQQFMDMDGLYWIEQGVLEAEVEKLAHLKPLMAQIKDRSKWRQIRLDESAKPKPRKTFMDVFKEMSVTNETVNKPVNGPVNGPANGDG